MDSDFGSYRTRSDIRSRPTGWRTNGSGRFSMRETIEFNYFVYGAQPKITVLVENGVKAGSETLDCRSTAFPGFL